MVRELLDELARDVPDYTDPDRALAAARAMRQRRVAATVGAVAAVLALVAGVLWWPRGAPLVQPAPARSPNVVEVENLPDGALGRVRLIYRPRCDGPCIELVVVMADGDKYRVRGPNWNIPSLSPDGRWLLTDGDGWRQVFKLRDLTADGTGDRPLPREYHASEWNPMTWSADSRWLLMWGFRRGSGPDEFARVDLRDGTEVVYTPPDGTDVHTVLPNGDLVVAPPGWTGPQPPRLVNPATGAERPLAPLDAALPAGQELLTGATMPALVSPDGRRLAFEIRQQPNRTVGVLEVDAETGALLRRFDLPADGTWRPVAYAPGGIALFDGRTRVGLLDPATGTVTETAALPPVEQLLLPGARTWH
ncbi:hypothetical protein Val02_17650 [Virgisporangium aliadipatigenens]|uniref:WD40 repeat protein n=1 Tax=Virgisporangium aliadipatigenens TaxID=741659 RepID=A0A8J3YGL4_9ACTN|nr:hypothetical protein [Virgisporangium aliadipatigenens]GIJ44879.1 hypothetical protein Val02_17650 [Virgisporangium aliadipatigenens]